MTCGKSTVRLKELKSIAQYLEEQDRRIKSVWGSVENMHTFFNNFEEATSEQRIEMVTRVLSGKKERQ